MVEPGPVASQKSVLADGTGRGGEDGCITQHAQVLASSALGDNQLRYLEMPGRCLVDVMKAVQRDHRLDSYKLDSVAEHFLGLNKHDVSPNDIFRLQRGTAEDRRTIAEYCVQV